MPNRLFHCRGWLLAGVIMATRLTELDWRVAVTTTSWMPVVGAALLLTAAFEPLSWAEAGWQARAMAKAVDRKRAAFR